VLAATASDAWSEAQSACPELTRCPDDRGAELSARARSEANLATAAFVGAGVAALGALVLGLLSEEPGPARASALPRIEPGGASVALVWTLE
jgi:hypothetical protein